MRANVKYDPDAEIEQIDVLTGGGVVIFKMEGTTAFVARINPCNDSMSTEYVTEALDYVSELPVVQAVDREL